MTSPVCAETKTQLLLPIIGKSALIRLLHKRMQLQGQDQASTGVQLPELSDSAPPERGGGIYDDDPMASLPGDELENPA